MNLPLSMPHDAVHTFCAWTLIFIIAICFVRGVFELLRELATSKRQREALEQRNRELEFDLHVANTRLDLFNGTVQLQAKQAAAAHDLPAIRRVIRETIAHDNRRGGFHS